MSTEDVPSASLDSEIFETIRTAATNEAHDARRRFEKIFQEASLQFNMVIAYGDARDCIMKALGDFHIDTLIVGNRGHGALKRYGTFLSPSFLWEDGLEANLNDLSQVWVDPVGLGIIAQKLQPERSGFFSMLYGALGSQFSGGTMVACLVTSLV